MDHRKVIGIDYSLTGTGLAVLSEQQAPVVATIKTDPKHFAKTPRGHIARIDHIYSAILELADPRPGDMILIEGLSMHSKSSSLDKIFGGWWLLVDQLGVDPVVVPPNNLKLYATGKGNAAKEDVLLAMVRRHDGIDLRNNNEADALALASIGRRHLGSPLEALPAKNLEALDKIDWGEWA